MIRSHKDNDLTISRLPRAINSRFWKLLITDSTTNLEEELDPSGCAEGVQSADAL